MRAAPTQSNFLPRLCATAAELFGATALAITLKRGISHRILGLCDINGKVYLPLELPLGMAGEEAPCWQFAGEHAGQWGAIQQLAVAAGNLALEPHAKAMSAAWFPWFLSANEAHHFVLLSDAGPPGTPSCELAESDQLLFNTLATNLLRGVEQKRLIDTTLGSTTRSSRWPGCSSCCDLMTYRVFRARTLPSLHSRINSSVGITTT